MQTHPQIDNDAFSSNISHYTEYRPISRNYRHRFANAISFIFICWVHLLNEFIMKTRWSAYLQFIIRIFKSNDVWRFKNAIVGMLSDSRHMLMEPSGFRSVSLYQCHKQTNLYRLSMGVNIDVWSGLIYLDCPVYQPSKLGQQVHFVNSTITQFKHRDSNRRSRTVLVLSITSFQKLSNDLFPENAATQVLRRRFDFFLKYCS